MSIIDKTKPVMVTGATGYIAGWIVKNLLENGFKVNAAVRDINNIDKKSHLDAIAKKSNGEIKYFESDLLDNGSYSEAMFDCQLVIHTASPFLLDSKDAQKQIIDPAFEGTKNVLQSVNEAKSVKRVVLTSSVAAIYGDAIEGQTAAGGVLMKQPGMEHLHQLIMNIATLKQLLKEKPGECVRSRKDGI